MSFGFSPSDIVSLIALTTQAYQGWRDACGHYADITDSLDILLRLLERLKAHVPQQTADSSAQPQFAQREAIRRDLATVVRSSNRTVRDVNRVLDKHKSLGTSKKRNWDRIRFGTKDIDSFRIRLSQHITSVSAFLNVVELESIGRVDQNVDAMPDVILQRLPVALGNFIDSRIADNASVRRGSCMTAYSSDDRHVWREFRRECVRSGIKSDTIEKFRPELRSFFKDLISEEEEIPPNVRPADAQPPNTEGQNSKLRTGNPTDIERKRSFEPKPASLPKAAYQPCVESADENDESSGDDYPQRNGIITQMAALHINSDEDFETVHFTKEQDMYMTSLPPGNVALNLATPPTNIRSCPSPTHAFPWGHPFQTFQQLLPTPVSSRHDTPTVDGTIPAPKKDLWHIVFASHVPGHRRIQIFRNEPFDFLRGTGDSHPYGHNATLMPIIADNIATAGDSEISSLVSEPITAPRAHRSVSPADWPLRKFSTRIGLNSLFWNLSLDEPKCFVCGVLDASATSSLLDEIAPGHPERQPDCHHEREHLKHHLYLASESFVPEGLDLWYCRREIIDEVLDLARDELLETFWRVTTARYDAHAAMEDLPSWRGSSFPTGWKGNDLQGDIDEEWRHTWSHLPSVLERHFAAKSKAASIRGKPQLYGELSPSPLLSTGIVRPSESETLTHRGDPVPEYIQVTM